MWFRNTFFLITIKWMEGSVDGSHLLFLAMVV
jgi:hypothetical protein